MSRSRIKTLCIGIAIVAMVLVGIYIVGNVLADNYILDGALVEDAVYRTPDPEPPPGLISVDDNPEDIDQIVEIPD